MLWGLAKWASPLSCTGAGESIDAIAAGPAVQTGVASAFVDVLITVHSLPARVAEADVARG